VAFYLLAFEMIRNVIVSLLATIAYSTHAWLLRWAGTGMETSLAVLLVLVAFVFVLRNEYFVATVFTALLTLVRPESFLLLGLIVIDVLVNSTNRSRAVQLGAGLLVMYAALILPWLIYAYSTFGTIVPNTALAKAGLALNIDNEASTFVDLAKTLAITDALAIVVLVIAGIALLRQGATTAHGQNGFEHMYFYTVRQSLMAIGWIVIVPIFYVMTDVNVISRYLLIVSPLIVVCAFFFLHRAMSASRQAKYSFVAAFLLTVGIMLQNQIVYRRYVVPHMQEFEQGMDMCLIPIGKWLNVNTSPDAKVFVQDIGAIGYYSDRTICDAAGLVSPTLLRLIRQGYTQREMMEKKIYKTDCHADYVVFRSPVAGKWQKDPGLFPVMTKPFIGLGLSNPQLQYYTVYKVK
jgi:arabinofuranosyltransferase